MWAIQNHSDRIISPPVTPVRIFRLFITKKQMTSKDVIDVYETVQIPQIPTFLASPMFLVKGFPSSNVIGKTYFTNSFETITSLFFL